MSPIQKVIDFMNSTNYPLKSYQVKGVKWMMDKEQNSVYKGGILGDDPGLGKTIQTIGLMVGRPFNKNLIIVPKAVISQWYNILVEIFGQSSVYLHSGINKARTSYELLTKNFSICLTTPGLLVKPRAKTKEDMKTILHKYIKWDRIVIDEGHILRNIKTKIHKSAVLLPSKHKWILSGTPIQNSKKDAIALLHFVGLPIDITKVALQDYIQIYMLRRTKELLFGHNGFSDYTIVNHIVPFKSKKEAEFYSNLEESAIRFLRTVKNKLETKELNMVKLELLLRLRQTSSHPAIAIDGLKRKLVKNPNNMFELQFGKFSENKWSSKMLQICKDITNSDGYCLVFAQYHKEMELLKKLLFKATGIKSELYHGGLNIKEREKIVDIFNDPTFHREYKDGKHQDNKPRVLIVQIKAGGIGLNLQQFNNVFILSSDWNPSNEIQAISRAHRMGQKRKVNVHKYTLVYKTKHTIEENNTVEENTTIDERILQIQQQKRNTMVELLHDKTLEFKETFTGRYSNRFTKKDIKYLISGK